MAPAQDFRAYLSPSILVFADLCVLFLLLLKWKRRRSVVFHSKRKLWKSITHEKFIWTFTVSEIRLKSWILLGRIRRKAAYIAKYQSSRYFIYVKMQIQQRCGYKEGRITATLSKLKARAALLDIQQQLIRLKVVEQTIKRRRSSSSFCSLTPSRRWSSVVLRCCWRSDRHSNWCIRQEISLDP